MALTRKISVIAPPPPAPPRQVPLPLANATEAGWSELEELEDQVLAVSAMFGMFQVRLKKKQGTPAVVLPKRHTAPSILPSLSVPSFVCGGEGGSMEAPRDAHHF